MRVSMNQKNNIHINNSMDNSNYSLFESSPVLSSLLLDYVIL